MYSLQWMGAVRIRFQTADKNITILMTPAHQLTSCEVKSFLFIRVVNPKYWFVQWKVSSESGEKYAQIKHMFENIPNQFLDFCHKQWFKAKGFDLQDINWWTGVMWINSCNSKFLQICSTEETISSTSLMALRLSTFFGWTFPLMQPQVFFFFFFFFLTLQTVLDIFVKKDFSPYIAKSTVKQLREKQTSVERQEGSAVSLQPVCVWWVTGVKGQCCAGPSELRHKPLFTVIGWDRPVTPGGLRGISPSPSSEDACGLNGLCIWCLSRTLPSLHFYQIFIMLSYSTLTVWQNSIMWTRWPQIVTPNCENNFYKKSWEAWKQTKCTLYLKFFKCILKRIPTTHNPF